MLALRSEDHRSRLVNELNRDSKKRSKTHQGKEADIDCNEDCTVSSSGFRFDFSSLLPSSVDNPYGLVRRCNVVQKYVVQKYNATYCEVPEKKAIRLPKHIYISVGHKES